MGDANEDGGEEFDVRTSGRRHELQERRPWLMEKTGPGSGEDVRLAEKIMVATSRPRRLPSGASWS
jgi:hypothetical protein